MADALGAMITIRATEVPYVPGPHSASFQPKGANRNPMSNAERQAAWRKRHKGSNRHMVQIAPPPGASPAPQSAAAPQMMAAPALLASSSQQSADSKKFYEIHIRPMSTAQKLH